MRKTIIAMVAAAAVLVIGGAIGAVAQEDTAPETGALTESSHPDRGHHIAGLLDEMVADGVIDESQSADIAAWLEDRRSERQAEREAARAAFEEAWSDDVLTREEAETLPHADRLLAEDGPFAEAWEDGQLTRDEVAEIRSEFPRRRGHHRGSGFGIPAPTGSSLDA